MKILITAAATAQAYKIEKLLTTAHNIVFADSVDLPAITLKDKVFIKIPLGSSATFSHQLLTLCLDENIQKVFPLRKAEVYALAEARQLFEEYGIQVMVPALDDLPLFSGDRRSGDISIEEDTEGSGLRGIFLLSEDKSIKQILTVD